MSTMCTSTFNIVIIHSISTRSVLSQYATDSTPAGIKHTHEIHQNHKKHKSRLQSPLTQQRGRSHDFPSHHRILLDLHFILVHNTHSSNSKVNETRINTRNFHRGFWGFSMGIVGVII